MTEVSIERCQFIRSNPLPVQAISTRDGLLAVARKDASIDIYFLSGHHHQLRHHIPAHPSHSIEAMIWLDSALITAGITGHITLWDYRSSSVIRSYEASSTPIWSMSASPSDSMIAAGSEDGNIRLFSIDSNNRLQDHRTLFPPTPTRCLSLSWHPTRPLLASSHFDGTVHIWDTLHSRLCHTFTASDSIWALQWTHEGRTLAAGDSRGRLHFYQLDPFPAHLQTIQTHQASIFSLCTALDPNIPTIYAAGIDPTICQLRYQDNRWKITGRKRRHTHDVRQLCISSNLLVSGGLDGNIIIHAVKSFPYDKPLVLRRQALCSTASSERFLISTSPYDRAQLWRLSPPALELEIPLSSPATALALSPDGRSLLISNSSSTRLFSASPSWNSTWSVPHTSHHLAFISATRFITVICKAGTYLVCLYELSSCVNLLSQTKISGHVLSFSSSAFVTSASILYSVHDDEITSYPLSIDCYSISHISSTSTEIVILSVDSAGQYSLSRDSKSELSTIPLDASISSIDHMVALTDGTILLYSNHQHKVFRISSNSISTTSYPSDCPRLLSSSSLQNSPSSLLWIDDIQDPLPPPSFALHLYGTE